MTTDWIESLKKQQFDLRCEKAMHSIQSFKYDEYLQNVKDDYSSFLLKEKKYFMHFIETGNNIKSPVITRIDLQDIKSVKLNNEIYLDSITYFIEELTKNDCRKFKINSSNHDFISTLVFSLFPSISNYFHINLIPETENNDEIIDFQVFNYSNVFLYLSKEIEKISDGNEKKNVYRDIFDLLMRPMFASPLFIDFSVNFFQPIFSELQNLEIDDKLKSFSIQTYLSSSFDSYFNICLHLIPPFICINLKFSDNVIRTLQKSFFDVALKNSESSQYYGLFHYSKPPSESLLKSLRSVFLEPSEVIENLAVRFVSVGDVVIQQMSEWKERDRHGELNILTCSCSETKLDNIIDDINDSSSRVSLALKMKEYYFEENVCVDQNQSLFSKVLLSSLDVELLEYILSDDQGEFKFSSKSKNEWTYVNLGFKQDEQNDWGFLFLSNTIRGSLSEIAPNLRHLLQNSDPIPEFKTPPKMNIEEFFDEYLVSRGPIYSLAKRKLNKKVIFDILPKDEKSRIRKIIKYLPETTLDQDNEIQKLTIASLVNKKIDEILLLCYKIDKSIGKLDNVIFLNKKENQIYLQNFKSSNNDLYIKNPKLFEENVNFNFKNLNKKILSHPESILMKMIDKADDRREKGFFAFGKVKIVYRPFFLDFKISSELTVKIDEQLNSLLKYSGEKMLDEYFKLCFPTENVSNNAQKKSLYLQNRIKQIPKSRQELIKICRDSFSEYSIIRKVELFSIFLNEFYSYISQDLPDYIKEIGADDLTPLVSFCIFLANPYYISTNLQIMVKFFSNFYKSDFTDGAFLMMSHISSALLDLLRIMKTDNSLVKLQDQLIKSLSTLVG